MWAGIFARTFARPSPEETMDAVVSSGVRSVQLNLSIAGVQTLPARIEPQLADRLRRAVLDSGLEAAAISGTYNMAHPDPLHRASGARRLAELIASTQRLGTAVVTLCTGSRDPVDMWRWHPDNGTSEAWRDMRASVEAALSTAESRGVVLALEPEWNTVVDSAPAARRLLDQLRSPELKVVLDAANLFPGGRLREQRTVLEQTFELLGDDVVLVHAKDLADGGRIVPAGQGALDYDVYIALLDEAGYRGPLVLHGLGEEDVAAAVTFLRTKLGRAAD
jgi:sugar phosphate isomerase/epimerase